MPIVVSRGYDSLAEPLAGGRWRLSGQHPHVACRIDNLDGAHERGGECCADGTGNRQVCPSAHSYGTGA